VFFITNTVLFWFAGKYYMRKGRQAFWYPHNNTLEIWWTVVPAVVMIGIIIYGLITWNRIVAPAHPDTLVMELYAKQFDWTARYPGKDGRLGATDYRLINATNPLGIVTTTAVKIRLEEIAKEKTEIEAKLAKEVLPEDKQAELYERVEHLERTATRIVHLRTIMEQDIAANGASSQYLHGSDDIVTKEFHLPVRKEVSMVIRSRDVIHSMFLPHLRAQMNAVPGMTTTFRMTPTITTDSMRTVLNDPAFDYILMCNKICGASHYNMQMPLTVEPETAYETWMAGQLKNPFEGAPTADAPVPSSSSDSTQAAPTATAQAVTPAKP
jgi:cytochrome c oxidase subunit 2